MKFQNCNYSLFMAIFWAIMIIPTIIWWKESVLWVALMSLYANISSSMAAYYASKANDKQNG